MVLKSKEYSNINYFILDGIDYYVAILTDKSVRIGFKNNVAFTFPETHAEYANVTNVKNEDEAEDIHDTFMSLYYK